MVKGEGAGEEGSEEGEEENGTGVREVEHPGYPDRKVVGPGDKGFVVTIRNFGVDVLRNNPRCCGGSVDQKEGCCE